MNVISTSSHSRSICSSRIGHTLDARASIGGRNLTEEVGDETQPCEELDASLTTSIETVGDISLAELWDPRELPEPLLL